MSTDYVTKEPMTVPQFRIAMRGIRHDAQDVSKIVAAADAKPHVMFTRYGRGNVSAVLETIACYSEHDDEFQALVYGDAE